MPIEVGAKVRKFDQEEFHFLDRLIMRLVFDIHNEFGPLMGEDLYKRELATRCVEVGAEPVEREVRIRVRHESFVKDYSMDLLFCGGFLLEAKVAEGLVAAHRAQAINYLLLAGLAHGRLVNFGSQRAQYEFISTSLTLEERRRITIEDGEWLQIKEASRLVHDKTIELLGEWGAFLDVNLYREALVHFLGGSNTVSRQVEIRRGSRLLGIQRLNLLDETTGLAVTAKRRGIGMMRRNLERLLWHTDLEHIQWINLNNHRVEFTTLSTPNRFSTPEADRVMVEL